MHAGVASEALRTPDPPRWNVQARIGRLGNIVTGEPAHYRSSAIEDLEENRPVGRAGERVIDDRASGRFLSRRLVDRERRVGVLIPASPYGASRPEEVRARRARRVRRVAQLAQRRDAVENPK